MTRNPWSKAAIAAWLLVLAGPPGCVGLSMALMVFSREAGALMIGAVLLPIAGAVWAGRVQKALTAMPAAERPRGLGFAIAARILTVCGFFVGFGMACAVAVGAAGSRGRQVRRFGRATFAPLDEGARWLSDPNALDLGDASLEQRRALADAWRDNGKTEHASVAAFARLSLDLLALGAPKPLIDEAHQDALDESRHTDLCYSLARDLDGRNACPAAFPAAWMRRTFTGTRSLFLARLAVDSFLDGAIQEGVSARTVARLVRRCESERIRAVLMSIASDEGRHAAHAWSVLEWCVYEGGAPVKSALRGCLRALPKTMHTPRSPDAAAGLWERHGLPGDALEAVCHAEVRAAAVARLERLLEEEPVVLAA